MSYDYAFTLPRWASGRSNDVFNDDGANNSAVSGLTSNVTTGTSYSDVISSGSGRNVGSTRSILDQQSIAGSDTRSNKFDQIMEMDDDFDLYLLRARNRLCSGKFLFKCTLCMGVLCFIVGISTLNWASSKHEDAIMQSQTNRNNNDDNNSMSEAALSSISSSTATIMTMTLPSPPYDLTDKCSYESIHTREGLAACEMICGPATHCCLSKDNQECFEKHVEECNIYSESCQIINITNDVNNNNYDSSSSSIVSAEVGTFPWDGTKDDENEATTESKVEKDSTTNTVELLHRLDDACYFQQDLSDCTELCDVGRCCFISLTLGEDKCTNDGIVLPITCEQYYEPCSVLSQFYNVDSDDEDITMSNEEEKQESTSSSLTTEVEEESTDAAATASASASESALLIAPANLDDICSMEDLSECMELCDTAARCCFEPLVECSPSLGYTDDVCNIYRPCSVLDIYDDEWNLSHIGASATRSSENVDDEIRVNY